MGLTKAVLCVTMKMRKTENRDMVMNDVLKSGLVDSLRALYKENPVAKRFFDHLADSKNDRRETTAAMAAAKTNASYGEITLLFKTLQNIRVGDFKYGRKGHETRIVWLYGLRNVGAVARGLVGQLEVIDVNELDNSELNSVVDESKAEDINVRENINHRTVTLINHTFQLRYDLCVKLTLPVDLTKKEAERLAGFIRQVPFDE